MRYWVTPFQLSATALNTLNEAGLQPWPAEGWSALPDAESLLLYDSPDRLIAMVGSGPETEGFTALGLLRGYRRLLSWSERTGQPLLAISQLQRLGPQGLRSWFDDGDGDAASPSPTSPLPIPPLLASVCLSLLVAEPALLDCYHDLELRAALLGRDPDLRYSERLLEAGHQGDALLQAFLSSQRVQAASSELEKRLASRDTELREVREEAELTVQQLHQVQEETEMHVLADAEKKRQLEAGVRDLEQLQRTKAAQERAHEQELEALRQRLEPRLAELEQHLASRDTELREAQEAAESIRLQLHQVQELLEQYFLADAEKQRQLEAGVRDLEELQRSKVAQESAHEQELQALRQQLEPRLAELEQRLASRDTELREARETAEMSMLQLHHQMQEERERHSMADAEQQRQLEAVGRDLEELRRTKAELESAHELAKAAQERGHEQELVGLRQRLEPRLAELEQHLASRDTELREAQEAAESIRLQLYQVQEELERYFLADAEKQRQLEAVGRDLEELRRSKADQEHNNEQSKAAQECAHEQELQALRQQLEPRLAELEQHLASRDTELREAREAAESIRLQLYQVQEELERYFLADAEKQRQLEAVGRDLEELRRSKADLESNHEQSKAAQLHAHEQELQALRQQLEPRLAELEQHLASRDTELREARETAELSLLQLHQQVQEERERYSMADAEKQRQLEAVGRDLEELRRSKADQESNHEQSKAAQEHAQEQELQALRQQLEPRLAELEQGLASRDTELREARETAEMSMLQLHQQVQEERERYSMADAEKQRQLEAVGRDLEELRRNKADQERAHEQAMAELEQGLASRDTQLRDACEEAEITFQQLHQAQEGLEHYFLADAEKQRQLEAVGRDLEELRRSKAVQERAHEQELVGLRQQLEPRLAELEQGLASRDTELREARETAELSLLQLHQQVQEERERYSMADAEKQRQLEAVGRDLEELRRNKADQERAHEQAMAELEQGLASRDTELREARETAELSLLQLHQQVQEERERYSMADAEKQRQLEAVGRDLEQLRRSKADQERANEQAMAELEQGLASRDTQLRDAWEEAEITFQQLHQAQEELEHYFLKARASDQLAQAQLEQLQRAQSLMVRLNPDVLANAPYPPALAVEVLPELPALMPDPSLQTQALLSTYAASLQRASALLERARRG
jgi:chromosome segregation ATPase